MSSGSPKSLSPSMPCPTDCSACTDPLYATASGFTGEYSKMNSLKVEITNQWSATDCEWEGGDALGECTWEEYTYALSCVDGYWYLELSLASWGFGSDGVTCQGNNYTDSYVSDGRAEDGSGCPPTGNYTMRREIGGDQMDEATVTVAISTS